MKLRDLNCIYNKFHNLSDQDWLEVLIRSIMKPTIDGVHMPSFPPDEVQRVTHSVTNEAALRDAYMFFQEVKKYAQYCERAIEHTRTLLDFGCGWGRATRLFMKDLSADKIFGVDPSESRVLIARNCNPYLTFIRSTPHSTEPGCCCGNDTTYITGHRCITGIMSLKNTLSQSLYRRIA